MVVDPSEARLAVARSLEADALAARVPIDGLNRGLRPLRAGELPSELMKEFQRYVIVSHAAAVGAPLSRIEGRAALPARLNTLAAVERRRVATIEVATRPRVTAEVIDWVLEAPGTQGTGARAEGRRPGRDARAGGAATGGDPRPGGCQA
ncbi:MAG TPA: aromatic amino acid lyase [Propionicimonas sp.]|nr:aromatic amino acid lyase [Propionicimonas sp.]